MIDFVSLCFQFEPEITQIVISKDLNLLGQFQIFMSCLIHG